MTTTTRVYKAYPALANGISRATSGGAAWSNSAYTEIVPASTITNTFYIHDFSFQYPNTFTVDVTYECVFDLATGGAGSETVIASIPFSIRIDSAVGHQATPRAIFPEPIQVSANTRVSVRVASAVATTSYTFNGIKIGYSE